MSQSTLRVIDSLVQWRSFNELRSTRSDTIDLSNIIKRLPGGRRLYTAQDSDEMTIGRTHPTLIYDNL